jgi:hypothetical protein
VVQSITLTNTGSRAKDGPWYVITLHGFQQAQVRTPAEVAAQLPPDVAQAMLDQLTQDQGPALKLLDLPGLLAAIDQAECLAWPHPWPDPQE